MFPNELQIQQHHKDMRRAAEQHHLAQYVLEDNAQPSLWQRLRTRLSASQPTVETVRTSGSVKSQKQNAIA